MHKQGRTGVAGRDDSQSRQLLKAAALNKSEENYHNRDHQQDMNESTHGVRRDQTKEPEDNENDGNCLKHGNSPFCMGKMRYTPLQEYTFRMVGNRLNIQ
jgi:TPR repeat protein